MELFALHLKLCVLNVGYVQCRVWRQKTGVCSETMTVVTTAAGSYQSLSDGAVTANNVSIMSPQIFQFIRITNLATQPAD